MWKKVSFLVTYYLTPNKNLPNNDLHFLFDNLGITPFIIVRHLTPFCSASFHLRLSFRLCLSSQWWEPPDSIMHTGLLPWRLRGRQSHISRCASVRHSPAQGIAYSTALLCLYGNVSMSGWCMPQSLLCPAWWFLLELWFPYSYPMLI